MLRFIVSRHESLRTRIVTDADGTPRQHVAFVAYLRELVATLARAAQSSAGVRDSRAA